MRWSSLGDSLTFTSAARGRGKNILVFTFIGLFIGFFFLIYSAVQAQYHLSRAKAMVMQANTASNSFTANDAADLLGQVLVEVAEAHKWTSGPLWWTASHIPFFGRTPSAIRTVNSTLADTLRNTANLRTVLASDNQNSSFRDFKFVLGLADPLLKIRPAIVQGSKSLSALNLYGVPNIIAEPTRKLANGYATLVPITADGKLFSTIAPALFGLDKPRKWMLVFQNGAEARATGGFPGGWGILSASQGRLTLSKIFKETKLMQRRLINYADYVSPEQAQLYGSDLSRMSDLNLSPDYPTNAKLMVALEELNYGQFVDGVISMNEQALANFMSVTGPVTLDNRIISAENVADYVTKGVYQDFPDPKEKDAAVFSIIEKTFAKFQTGAVSPFRMLQSFIPAIHSQNLHAWSRDKSVQSRILRTPISGSMNNLKRPTAAVVLINGAGNKLDAYVNAKITYDQGVCRSEFPYRDAEFKIELQNSAPKSGLPLYVTTRYDRSDLTPSDAGATKMLVYVHVPFGSVFESATVNGKPTALVKEGSDMERTVFRLDVELPAQHTQNLVLKYAEPDMGNEPDPTLWTQSMPNKVKSKVLAGLGCS